MFDSVSFDIARKRFSHDALEEVGAIFLRVSEGVCQDSERQSSMEIGADVVRDCGAQHLSLRRLPFSLVHQI